MKKLYQILYNSRYVFLINFTEKIVFFVFFLILARQLDKSSYGLIATVFAFTNILNAFFDPGFTFYFQREAESNKVNEKLSAAFSLRSIGLVLFTFIMLGYLYFYLHIDLMLIAVIGSLTYLNGFNVLLNAILYGRRKYKKSYHSFLISRLLFAGLIILFFITGAGNELLLVSLLISVAFQLMILLVMSRKEGIRIFPSLDFSLLRSMLRVSVPIGVGSIFVLLYDKFDVLIIERLVSLEAVAVYAIAYSIYKLFHIISNVILTPVFTDFSSSFNKVKTIDRSELKNVLLLLVFISLGAVVLVELLGEQMVVIIYSSKYLDSVQYLSYLILALPALYLNNLTGVIANSIRQERIPMVSNGYGVLINLAGNFILILLIGVWGAVAATIVTEYSVLLIQYMKLRYINSRQSFILAKD